MNVREVARWVGIGALFLIPFTPIIVANNLFFPFITGKAFYFRTLVEIAFGAWIVLSVLDARYRPRFSYIEIAVVAFVAWMLFADLFSLNVTKALWSNFERMEGWVLLAHLGAFFIAASSILRVDKLWRLWFLLSVGISLILIGHAFLQGAGSGAFGESVKGAAYEVLTSPKDCPNAPQPCELFERRYPFPIHQGSVRIDASLGNSIYFAVYLLFNTFIAGWLAFTEKRKWLSRTLYAVSGISMVFIFLTQTRGTILGLVGALALAAILTLFEGGKTVRRIAAGGLVAILLLVGGFIMIRDTQFVQEHDLLNRIAHISLQDGQTRFTLWGIAFQGFLESPIVGWGQEGFNYVFNKYYVPSLWAQEVWFDRAHNAFVDWLSAGGLPAFLLYLSLFGAAIYTLWKSALPRPERIIFTSLIVGYAFHNVFVFDNIYSYVYFFAILAFVDSHVGHKVEKKQVALMPPPVVLGTATAATLLIFYFVNVPGYTVASGLIGIFSGRTASPEQSIELLRSYTSSPLGRQEVREQVVNYALSVVQAPSIPDATKLSIANFAVEEMKKEVDGNPRDARAHLQLAFAYRIIGNLEEHIKQLDAAIALSPKKQNTLLQKGLTLLEVGRREEARDLLESAYKLDERYTDLAKYTALANLAVGDFARANEIIAQHPQLGPEIEKIVKDLSTKQQ